MIADLHVHYPMRVVEDVTTVTAREAVEGLLLRAAGRLFSDRTPASGYRVTVDGLRAGGVGVALSVLYRPLQEMDLGKPYGSPPDDKYFRLLVRDVERVEAEVGGHHRDVIRVVHDVAALDVALRDGATALIHCVEGGFHLGATPASVAANVAELAALGVAYVTVAHLFYRQVAANANAVPFIDDEDYDALFPQPRDAGSGLAPLGEAVVRALVAEGVLVDLSHMRGDAVTETLDLMDTLDPGRGVPVIASHAGYRFGEQDYMLDDATVERIRARDGVIGLILAQHQLRDGLVETATEDIIFRHVDKLAQLTGGYDHVALGSDLDGFIKPTLTGLDSAADLGRLETALRSRYAAEDAEKLLNGNALRVLRAGWGRRA